MPPVEVVEKRTRNSKTHYLGEHRYAWSGTLGAIHYKNIPKNRTEQWKDIDTTISAEGKIRTAPYDLDVYLTGMPGFHYKSKESGEFNVRLKAARDGKEKNEKSLTAIIPVPKIKGNWVIWENIYPDVDVVIRAQNTRVSLLRIVKSDKSPLEYEIDTDILEEGVAHVLPIRPAIDANGQFLVMEETKIVGGRVEKLKLEVLSEEGTTPQSITYPIEDAYDVEEEVGADNDHCKRTLQPSNFALSPASAYLGDYSASYYDYRVGQRLQTVAVPNGATIDTANLRFKAFADFQTAIPTVIIHGEAIDDAAEFSTLEDYDGRDRTSASISWTPAAWVSGTWYTSDDIKTIVAEITSRPGWATGQDMVFFEKDTDGYISQKRIRWWTYSHPTSTPVQLNINYTIPPPDPPTVTTQAVTDIAATTATGNGNITDDGGEDCDKRGIVYGTSTQGDPGDVAPGVSGYDDFEEETDGFGTGAFTRSLTGLDPGTLHYARAYAHNSGGYSYGDEVSFTTVFVQAVGEGTVGIAGAVKRLIKTTVGSGAIGMAGALNRKIKIAVGTRVEILRPNAAGDETDLASQFPDSGEHWAKVDEVTPDDADTYVRGSVDSLDWKRDLYNLPASSGSDPIRKIVVYARFYQESYATDSIKISIKSDSVVSDSPAKHCKYGDTWTTLYQEWLVNPADGQPWEWTDVDELQIGVAMRRAWSGYANRCTQVYVEIKTGGVGITGTLAAAIKYTQAVGAGAVAITGTLGRNIFKAVGEGSLTSAGTLGRKISITVGAGAVASVGTLISKLKVFVGGGAVAIAGTLIGKFVYAIPVVKISGVQVTILRNSLLIDMRIEERSIAEFTVIDKTGSSHYQKGEPVLIYDNGNHLTFGGVIDTPEEERRGSGLYHRISFADYHYLADKRIARETYVDELAGDIVKHLRTTYLDGEGITAGTIQDGPTLKQVKVNYVRVSEALDKLAEMANFIWYIDENKALQFLDRATNTAPWTATNLEIIRGSARLSHGNPLYRNRQFIRGGRAQTDEQTEVFTGDGVRLAFTVGYPLALTPSGDTGSVSVTGRDPVLQTVGIKGIDTGKDCYWNKGDATITFDTEPENAETVTIVYTGEFDIITLSEDEDAIIDRQTIEGGGTGYVDDLFRDTTVSSMEAAFETAAKKLQRYAVMGRKFTFSTHERGLYPGQLLTVNHSLFGLDNAELLIEAVKIKAEGKLFTYIITAIEGPEVGGWSKFFQQLVEREKTIDRLTVGEEGTLLILVQESEEWGWNEAVSVTPIVCSVPSVDLHPDAALFPC